MLDSARSSFPLLIDGTACNRVSPMVTPQSNLGQNIWGPPSPPVAEDFARFSSDYSQDFFEGLWSPRENAPTLAANDDGRAPAEFLSACIDSGEPAALIRFGDGEGNLLLSPMNQYQKLNEYCLQRISYIIFGSGKVIPDAKDFFLDLMVEAWNEANIAGIPGIGTVRRGFSTYAPDIDVRAVCGNRAVLIHAERRAHLLPANAHVVSAWISRGLLPHYGKILNNRPHLGVISAYPELSHVLQATFNIGNVEFHQIPIQAVFVPTAERRDNGHYPDAFERIAESIRPTVPGMPYIIAAGLLGKKYAVLVKKRGGVALDVGSIAEVWLGKPCRGLKPEFLDRWRLV